MRRDYKEYYETHKDGLFLRVRNKSGNNEFNYSLVEDLYNDRPNDRTNEVILNIAEHLTDISYYKLEYICREFYDYKYWALIVRNIDLDIEEFKSAYYTPFLKEYLEMSEYEWMEFNKKMGSEACLLDIAEAVVKIYDYKDDLYKRLVEEYSQKQKTDFDSQSGDDIIKDKLKSLFYDDFIEEQYRTKRDIDNKIVKVTRFDDFYEQLSDVLQNKKTTTTLLARIAYMVYVSKYTRKEYRKPMRDGKRGLYTSLLTVFFEAIGRKLPKDTSPNNYSEISDNYKMLFKCLERD